MELGQQRILTMERNKGAWETSLLFSERCLAAGCLPLASPLSTLQSLCFSVPFLTRQSVTGSPSLHSLGTRTPSVPHPHSSVFTSLFSLMFALGLAARRVSNVLVFIHSPSRNRFCSLSRYLRSSKCEFMWYSLQKELKKARRLWNKLESIFLQQGRLPSRYASNGLFHGKSYLHNQIQHIKYWDMLVRILPCSHLDVTTSCFQA